MAEYAGKTVVFQSEGDVNEAIRQYEEETVTHFVTSTVMKSFSKTEMKVNRFRWYVNARNDCGVAIPYDRVPFCFVGKKAMTCHMGEDRGKATKKKYQEHKAQEEANGVKKYRQRAPVPTKKSSCVAKISIKKVVKFPEFKLDEGKEANYDQRLNNKRLLAALNTDSEAVVKQLQYYVKFPAIEDHKDHPMGEEAAKKEPIDRRVHTKMKQLADTGVSSYTALQKLVYAFVEKELFKDKPLPPRTRRRYFPSLKDVQNFMTKYKGKKSADSAPKEQDNKTVFQVWEEDGGDDDRQDDAVSSVQGQPQPHQLASRSEQESFLSLLNTGMADANHQEVVQTVQTDHTIEGENQHQMVHDGTQALPVGIHVVQHDGTAQMHDGMSQMHDGTTHMHDGVPQMHDGVPQMHDGTPQIVHDGSRRIVTDGTQLGHDGTQLGQDGTQLGHDGTQMGQSVMTVDPSSSAHMLSTASAPGVPTSIITSAPDVHHQQIVSMSHHQEEMVQTSQGLALPTNPTSSKGPRKPQRIGLVCRMKALTHELLDYSLLVKELPVLEGFVGELERMVDIANHNATLNPMVVQNELARNRRKRQAGPPDFSGPLNKIAHLSDIL